MKDSKDPLQYKAKLRFLPNLREDSSKGLSIFKKHTHYLKMANEPTLSGYVDCVKNFDKDCPICIKYWAWDSSKNAADQAKQQLIQRQTKWYSYVLVEEDENHPEWVGKIMIWPYGIDISTKISMEKKGENQEEAQCDVFNILEGKTLQLIIKPKGEGKKGDNDEKITYAQSYFLTKSPIKLYDEKSTKFVSFPTDPAKQEKAKEKFLKIYFAKEVMLEDHLPKRWDDETINKVDTVLSILSGKEVYQAQQNVKKAKTDAVQEMNDDFDDIDEPDSPISGIGAQSADDFFTVDSDDD
jgi:protein-tyrosine-phosphatase